MTAPDRDHPIALEGIDLSDPAHYSAGSQHPAWSRLREDVPVWTQSTPDGIPFWSVTRYEDVVAILKDTRAFGSEHGTILAVVSGDIAGGKTINLMDPPRHTHIRVPTMRTMSTHVMTMSLDRIRQHIRQSVQPLLSGGTVDAAQTFMSLPMTAIGEVLGIPQDMWQDISIWTMRGVAPQDPVYSLGTAEQTLLDAHSALFDMFSSLIAHRRRHPGEDLISMLVGLDFGGRPLTQEEVLLNCYSFTMGASTTTPHVASHLILEILERPAIWRELTADPARTSTAVEEALRWATPTNHLLRRATRPITLHGIEIPQGGLVCAWVASANRDERMFDDPFTFDIRRRINRHIAFGAGRHYCIGAPAARVALRLLVEELLHLIAEFEPAGTPAHVHSNFINGLTRLPVRARLLGTRSARAS